MIRYSRLVTPPRHLDLLIEPPDAAVSAWRRGWDANRTELRLLDAPLATLRAALGRQLGLRIPAIVAGHQAEFFHPGVLAKTIAADLLAEATGGEAIFLCADSDLPKQTAVAFPVTAADGRVVRRSIPLPGIDPTRAIESQPRLDPHAWQLFFRQLREALGAASADAPLDAFATAWLRDGGAPLNFAEALLRGQAAIETMLELRPARVLRMSALAETTAFRAFAATILCDAPRFAEAYNAAQRDFRAAHGVRNPQRPAPALRHEADRVEAPFWLLDKDGLRRRLFVRQAGDDLELWAEATRVALLPGAQLASVATVDEAFKSVPREWRLRPRALTLSAFCRLLLADVFLHGIGGAKYDEMTDGFLRRFFGESAEAAPIAAISATARLLAPPHNADVAAIRAARYALRDLTYNPQRRLADPPEALVARRNAAVNHAERLRAESPQDHAARAAAFRAIRAANQALLESDPSALEAAKGHVAQAEAALAENEVASDREVFFALHPLKTLAALRDRLAAALPSKSHVSGAEDQSGASTKIGSSSSGCGTRS